MWVCAYVFVRLGEMNQSGAREKEPPPNCLPETAGIWGLVSEKSHGLKHMNTHTELLSGGAVDVLKYGML